MALPFYNWSRTAASNATADSTVNWSEGQAPSSVNDSARSMMASTAAFRDDISGAITTGGTSTAYTVTTYQVFDSLAHLNGQMIAFVPHATNTNTPTGTAQCTLSVDGLTAKPIRMRPSVEIPDGTLILGTPYVVVYNNSDGAFYLQNMTNPYNIPLAGGMPFFGSTPPNSSFVFPYGQTISTSTYSTLYALLSTTYNTGGEAGGTFRLPDLRGRVPAGLDIMGGAGAGRLTAASGMNGTGIGSVGGTETATILQANLPAVTLATTINDNGHTHTFGGTYYVGTTNGAVQGGSTSAPITTALLSGVATTSVQTGITASTALGGSGTALKLVQPTLAVNYIMRVI